MPGAALHWVYDRGPIVLKTCFRQFCSYYFKKKPCHWHTVFIILHQATPIKHLLLLLKGEPFKRFYNQVMSFTVNRWSSLRAMNWKVHWKIQCLKYRKSFSGKVINKIKLDYFQSVSIRDLSDRYSWGNSGTEWVTEALSPTVNYPIPLEECW